MTWADKRQARKGPEAGREGENEKAKVGKISAR